MFEDFQKSKYIKKHDKKMRHKDLKNKSREYRLLVNYKRIDKKKFILGVLEYHTESELRDLLDNSECIYCGATDWLGLIR